MRRKGGTAVERAVLDGTVQPNKRLVEVTEAGTREREIERRRFAALPPLAQRTLDAMCFPCVSGARKHIRQQAELIPVAALGVRTNRRDRLLPHLLAGVAEC